MAAQKKATTQAKRPTTVTQWKKQQGEPIKLPSGNYARLRGASMDFFLMSGFIPNSLKALVQNQISQMEQEQGKTKAKDLEAQQAKELASILEDEDKLRDLLSMYDRIAVHCFLEPTVRMPPEDAAERKDDQLYTDELDMEDKVFVFNVAVGGTKDLESFRQQQNASVESVRAGAEVAEPS
jgi:hypothetical protein